MPELQAHFAEAAGFAVIIDTVLSLKLILFWLFAAGSIWLVVADVHALAVGSGFCVLAADVGCWASGKEPAVEAGRRNGLMGAISCSTAMGLIS